MADYSNLSDLSQQISENTAIIQNFLSSNNLPQPSLSADAPLDFPVPSTNVAIQEARRKAMDAAKTLYDTLWSPEERSLHQFTTVRFFLIIWGPFCSSSMSQN